MEPELLPKYVSQSPQPGTDMTSAMLSEQVDYFGKLSDLQVEMGLFCVLFKLEMSWLTGLSPSLLPLGEKKNTYIYRERESERESISLGALYSFPSFFLPSFLSLFSEWVSMYLQKILLEFLFELNSTDNFLLPFI